MMSESISDFWLLKNMAVAPQPSDWPDLFLCDILFFPRMKLLLQRHCFKHVLEIQKQSLAILKEIPKSLFQQYFHLQQKC